MKVSITGSTGGLGTAIVNTFSDCELKLLDRNKGFDLEKNLNDFIDQDFDVFINNAHSGFRQTELLYKLFESNKNRNCIIINIGSVSSDGNKDYVNEYAIEENDTILIIGQIEHIYIQEALLGTDGWVQLDKGEIVSINGLDGYALPTLLERFEYARPKK